VRCYIAFLSRLSGAKIAELRATETPSQSVRYSIHLLPGTPFERPAPPLRRMLGERRVFNV
jgi:hypothetical protein